MIRLGFFYGMASSLGLALPLIFISQGQVSIGHCLLIFMSGIVFGIAVRKLIRGC